MTSIRRRASAYAALLGCLVLLAGCFGRGGNGGNSDALSVWMFPQGDGEVAIHAYEAAFEKAHSGTNVEIVVYPEEEYQTKINTALVAGNPPDVAIIESHDWMKAGYVVQLTDHLKEWGVSATEFSAGGLARGTIEDDPSEGVYAIGDFLGGYPIVYNKALFDAAGIDYPSADTSMTFQQYADLCRRLARPDPDPAKAIYGCTMSPDPFNFYPAYGADGRSPEGAMNSPELANAFEIAASLINGGFAPSGSILDTISDTDLFAQGQIGMGASDFSAVPTFEEANIDFGMAPFFVVQGQPDFVDTWTSAWGTFTESRHKDLALEFLRFIATDAQRIRMQVTPDPPLSTKVAVENRYGTDDPIKAQFLQVLANARPQVFVPPGEESWDPAEVLRLLTVEGQTDAKPILDDMAAKAQQRVLEIWDRWQTLSRADFEHQVQDEASATPAPEGG